MYDLGENNKADFFHPCTKVFLTLRVIFRFIGGRLSSMKYDISLRQKPRKMCAEY